MYKKILVPLDGSERAEKILPHVEGIALQNKSVVILIHVVIIPQIVDPTAEISKSGFFTSLGHRLESDKKKAEDYLSKMKARLQEKKIETQAHVVLGLPPDAISQMAEQENVDLVAMASHGRSGASQFFYGSVAVAVMNRVDRPLLMVRSR
jgi:nucleotide-binding universal stress UspA family protein